MNDELYYYLEAFDDPDLPDGAWWAKLENGVTSYNEEFNTEFDECDTVQEYINYEPVI